MYNYKAAARGRAAGKGQRAEQQARGAGKDEQWVRTMGGLPEKLPEDIHDREETPLIE